MSDHLSIGARTLPEQFRILVEAGAGLGGDVVVSREMLRRWASEAEELLALAALEYVEDNE